MASLNEISIVEAIVSFNYWNFLFRVTTGHILSCSVYVLIGKAEIMSILLEFWFPSIEDAIIHLSSLLDSKLFFLELILTNHIKQVLVISPSKMFLKFMSIVNRILHQFELALLDFLRLLAHFFVHMVVFVHIDTATLSYDLED